MRLWPLSRRNRPKQFIKFGEETLFAETLDRALAITTDVTVVTAVALEDATSAELPDELPITLLLEPEGRQTAPAAGLAALAYAMAGKDPVLLIMPADHSIKNTAGFKTTMLKAAETAVRTNALVCVGLKADTPETGFGYIRADREGRITQFVEKPHLEKAKEFVKSGKYLWNLGLFAAKASVLLAEMNTRLPAIYAVLEDIKAASGGAQITRAALEKHFKMMPSISIDHGLMENNPRAFAVIAEFDWSDVGSWQGVYDITPKDENGNAVIGDVLHSECSNCLFVSDAGLITAHGMTNTVLVKTADATLLCPLDHSQAVREIAQNLTDNHRPEIYFPEPGAAND